jgi:hypothetical protein
MSQHDDDVMTEEVVPASSPDDEDESNGNGNGHHLPDALHFNPDLDVQALNVVRAVNGLSVEIQLARKAISRIGTRIATNEQALEERLEAFEALLKRAIASRKEGQ